MSDKREDGSQKAPDQDAGASHPPPPPKTDPLLNPTVNGLLSLCREYGRQGMPPHLMDSINQVLVTVLGSGPAFAALESMLSANQANGLMYHNAVAQQQKTNVIAMVATANCVAKLLEMQPGTIWDELKQGDGTSSPM